jgi:hypothetical protein
MDESFPFFDESFPFFDRPDESFPPAIGSPPISTCDGLFSHVVVPPTLMSAEKQRIAKRLGKFDSRTILAYQKLGQRFGTPLRQEDLLTIAGALQPWCPVRLDRDAKRRKTVMLQWFAENWPLLEPCLGYIDLGRADMAGNPRQ